MEGSLHLLFASHVLHVAMSGTQFRYYSLLFVAMMSFYKDGTESPRIPNLLIQTQQQKQDNSTP